MTTDDWTQDDSNGTSLQDGVSAPDLFGGVLFGDELIDMYNSEAVVGEHEGDMPSLLGGPADAIGSSKIGNIPSMDDGFGAFRPSTSFNDLTTLLAPSPAAGQETVVAPSGASGPSTGSKTSTVTTTGTATKKTGGKKRTVSDAVFRATPDGPAMKKRGGAKSKAASSQGGRRGAKSKASSATKPVPQSAGHAALKLRQEQQALLHARNAKSSNNTPNPLVALSLKPQPATTPMVPVGRARSVPPPKVSGGKGDSITSEAAAAKAAAAAVSVSLSTSTSKTSQPNESDFKSVAQAAVTNLILNAGTTKVDTPVSPKSSADTDGLNIKIDTSTVHIKALTSSNWVNACAASTDGPVCPAAVDSKANNRARRQNLTPDERARQNRDRNREHARNTRLRKKAYVEELKKTLTELVSQRDTADMEKRHTAQRELEQREVRFRVMEELLKLRGKNEPNYARWTAILEDSFNLTLPVTEFRKMVHPKATGSIALDQVLHGAKEVMADSVNMSCFLQRLGNAGSSGALVTFQYHCERKNFFMDGCTAVLQWTATSAGGVGKGATSELKIKGTMEAKFSPASNKLISAEILFDSARVSEQLGLLSSSAQGDAAAQAAHRADALLDSLQMPQLSGKVPSAISLEGKNSTSAQTSTAVSVTSAEKEDLSSDESTEDITGKGSGEGLTPRRSTRVHA